MNTTRLFYLRVCQMTAALRGQAILPCLSPKENKPSIFHFAKVQFLVLLSFLLILPVVFAEEPTLEEIFKTEAAKAYVAKDFQKALEEFQKLEAEHPQSPLIKRYLAATYNSLNQMDPAIHKLEEALSINSNDLIAHQMLGGFYIRQVELDKAAGQYEAILSQDPEGEAGKEAKKKLEDIKQLKTSGRTEKGKQMAPQDFMKSEPAKEFSKGNYEKALSGFDRLLVDYPTDMLIRRFRGITLTKLRKTAEAIRVFEEALRMQPDNVAAHFYLGQAYVAFEKMEEARREFRWVMEHDEASYKIRAEQAMFQTLRGAPAPKPWTLNLSAGTEFDSNATFKSQDGSFATAGDQNSWRYLTTLIGTYRFYQKGRWTLTGDALYTQTVYNDFPRLNTYTSGTGISALYGFSLFDKPAFLNIREGATHTILKNKLYLWSNSVSTSLISIPHPRLRTTASYRWTYNEYENNGTDPDRTSRDGFVSAASLTNVFYFNQARTLYVTTGYEFERHDTLGRNFVKNMHGARLGVHFPLPLIKKVEGDFDFRFKDSNFVRSSLLPERRDDVSTLGCSLSRPLSEKWTLTGTYTLEDSKARNNTYEYTRQVFGLQASLKY